MTTLLLARHGQTEANAKQVFQGQTGAGLDDVGRGQAVRLAARVRALGVARLVASDLERAVETATIVNEALKLPLELDSTLREIDVGTWSGLTYEQAAQRHPAEWTAWHEGGDPRRGGGETYGELAQRISSALALIAETSAGKTTLVVTHGAALRSFVCLVLGIVPPGPKALGGASNCGLTSVLFHARGFRLLTWNEPVDR